MSSKHHHRQRGWAPMPEPLPTPTVDDHTHIASVVPFAKEVAREAAEREQPQVAVPSADELVAQAQAVGVGQMVDVGCDVPSLQTAVDLAAAHPGVVYAALAIHPNETVLHGHRGAQGPDGLPIVYQPWHDMPFDEALERVRELAAANPEQVVAIGETGMDLYRTGKAAKSAQFEAFRAHIALAKELNLPLQIHDRDAHEDVVRALLADGAPERTVFHSFSGDAAMAQLAREQGWYLSFSGTVGYKGNERLRAAARIIGLEHLLVETDAPYLTPMPYRGLINAPYMIPYTVAALADALDVSAAQVAAGAWRTAHEVYGLSEAE